MKDNLQNIADLIGALAEDIEEIKKKLDAKDSPDKDEALKRLEAKLEPVIQFFSGNVPENVNAIFGSKEAIEEYKQSIGDETVTSLRLYTEANEKDMHKHGVPTIKEQLNKILEMLTTHVEKDRQASEQVQQNQGVILGLWQAIMENPDILLLDEPMNGLDKHGVKEMRELFKSLAQQGKTIIMANHSAEDIEVLCDTVCEMDLGVLTRVK
jgi:ABC-type branched-subunit amino acid transport system ATPase component